MGAAAVGAGDRVDDREAEPRSVTAAGRIAPAEALERLPDEAGRKARTAVLDVDRDLAVALIGTDGDLPIAVLDRVLDEVRERLLEAQPVALHRHAVRRLDHQRASLYLRPCGEALAHVTEQLSDSDSPQVE